MMTYKARATDKLNTEGTDRKMQRPGPHDGGGRLQSNCGALAPAQSTQAVHQMIDRPELLD
jgi:hypothetical protein